MTQRAFSVFLECSREIILRKYRNDSCLETTRIASMVLANFGCMKTRPLSVGANIFNPAFVEWLKTHKMEELSKREEMDAFGGWCIRLGKTGECPPGKWDGHLVLIVADTWLCDLSIDQANRPHKNLILPPVLSNVTPEFLRGEETMQVMSSTGAFLEYEAYPEDKSYAACGGWRSHMNEKSAIVRTIVRKMEAETCAKR